MSVHVGKARYIYELQNLASGSHKDSWALGEGVPCFGSGGVLGPGWLEEPHAQRARRFLRLFLDNSSYLYHA